MTLLSRKGGDFQKSSWDFKIFHGLLSNKNIGINLKIWGPPHYLLQYDTFGRTRGVFSKVVLGFRNFAWAPR